MKKNIFLLFAIIGCFSSCSLVEDRESLVGHQDLYQTKNQCISVLNSCYIPLKSIYTYTYMIATEGVTDILYIPSGTQDAQLDISPAVPRFGSTVWNQSYQGVRNCNAAIAGITTSPVAEEDKVELLAEAKMLRAFYYYTLTCFFGDVPFYREHVNSVEELERVSHLPRMSAVETRNTLSEELMEFLPLLEQKRSCEVENNRIGAAFGWMLAAKMYMWNEKWEEAISALEHLESIYGDLSQYPLEDIMFRNKNTPESIFEIQHTWTAGGLNYTSNVACIFMPYPRKEGNQYTANEVVIEELGEKATTWSAMRPNVYFSQGLMSRYGGDLRLPMTLVWEWNGHTLGDTNSRPWMGPKWWCPNMELTYDSNNYKVFRYADALLMLSECHANLDHYELSMAYMNMVKERAGIEKYSNFTKKSRLMEEIRKERGRELVGEFQRKYDLVRWGIWYQETVAYNDYQRLQVNILPCHRYYPIPDTQVVYSDYALDNKEYEKYNL